MIGRRAIGVAGGRPGGVFEADAASSRHAGGGIKGTHPLCAGLMRTKNAGPFSNRRNWSPSWPPLTYQAIIEDGYGQNPLELSARGKKRGPEKKTKSRNLLERLDKHRSQVQAFLTDFNVPFDNNQAERDIRMMKVQQKISELFRSEEGATAFCRIRSYISTARKNALGALEAIQRIFTGTPFVPISNTS